MEHKCGCYYDHGGDRVFCLQCIEKDNLKLFGKRVMTPDGPGKLIHFKGDRIYEAVVELDRAENNYEWLWTKEDGLIVVNTYSIEGIKQILEKLK